MSYNNELLPQKPWLHRNWKWIVPVTFIVLLLTFVFIISKDIITGIGTDIYAHLFDKKWLHDSIDVRLKKPEKHTIKLLR